MHTCTQYEKTAATLAVLQFAHTVLSIERKARWLGSYKRIGRTGPSCGRADDTYYKVPACACCCICDIRVYVVSGCERFSSSFLCPYFSCFAWFLSLLSLCVCVDIYLFHPDYIQYAYNAMRACRRCLSASRSVRAGPSTAPRTLTTRLIQATLSMSSWDRNRVLRGTCQGNLDPLLPLCIFWIYFFLSSFLSLYPGSV